MSQELRFCGPFPVLEGAVLPLIRGTLSPDRLQALLTIWLGFGRVSALVLVDRPYHGLRPVFHRQYAIANRNAFPRQVHQTASRLPTDIVIMRRLAPNDTAQCDVSIIACIGEFRLGNRPRDFERTGNLDIVTVALNMYAQGLHPNLNFNATKLTFNPNVFIVNI